MLTWNYFSKYFCAIQSELSLYHHTRTWTYAMRNEKYILHSIALGKIILCSENIKISYIDDMKNAKAFRIISARYIQWKFLRSFWIDGNIEKFQFALTNTIFIFFECHIRKILTPYFPAVLSGIGHSLCPGGSQSFRIDRSVFISKCGTISYIFR